jgi:small ligand-binding sensory domain FIST
MDTLGLPETSHWIEVALVGQLAEELPADLHKEYGSTHILRCAMGNYDDNSIISPITLKKGTRLRLTERDEEGIFEGVDLMVKRVLKDLNGRKPLAVFHTDCATRGKRSFERILKDEIVSRMQDPICGDKNIPWIGAYGYAEIAMLGGKNRFHQFTSALYIIQRDTHQ